MKSLIIFLIFSISAMAQDEKPTKFPGGSAADLIGNTKFDPDKGEKKTTGGKIKFSAACTSGSGTVSNKGDPGFENCMVEKQAPGSKPQTSTRAKTVPTEN